MVRSTLNHYLSPAVFVVNSSFYLRLGVRNLVARNNMRAMRKGDLAFFYHSNCKVPGIAGVMRIVAEHSVDESAFNPQHYKYDPKSDREKPKWELVHVEFVRKFDNLVTLRELRSFSERGGALEGMQMLKQGRLSVSSVTPVEWQFILQLAGEKLSLGHGDGKGGYESDVDGEGAEGADATTGDDEGVDGGRDKQNAAPDTENDQAPFQLLVNGKHNTDAGGAGGLDSSE